MVPYRPFLLSYAIFGQICRREWLFLKRAGQGTIIFDPTSNFFHFMIKHTREHRFEWGNWFQSVFGKITYVPTGQYIVAFIGCNPGAGTCEVPEFAPVRNTPCQISVFFSIAHSHAWCHLTDILSPLSAATLSQVPVRFPNLPPCEIPRAKLQSFLAQPTHMPGANIRDVCYDTTYVFPLLNLCTDVFENLIHS